MKLLAIETSTMLGGVAILDNEKLIAESRINVKTTHSERLMSEIDRLLVCSSLKIDDIDVFGISIGPGSFTGLRVGLSAIKGLAYGTSKKIVSVPTLEAFAWNVSFSKYQVCPMLDARKKEVFAAIFKWHKDRFVRVMDERAIKIEELCRLIYEPTIFLGEGAILYKDTIEAWLKDLAILGNPQIMVPLPSNTAYLCMLKAKNGEFDDPITLTPFYLRKSEAEIRLMHAS